MNWLIDWEGKTGDLKRQRKTFCQKRVDNQNTQTRKSSPECCPKVYLYEIQEDNDGNGKRHKPMIWLVQWEEITVLNVQIFKFGGSDAQCEER